MKCCTSGRQTCFNLEAADYIAVDGFELIGGKYGVRAVGAGYPASEHSRGIAVLNCDGHDQDRDPILSGQADWAVWESNVAHGAKKDDGHGIYLSNGGDWNIVRFNETYGNLSSDFQINADPASTCAEPGIPFDDPRCDAYAGEGEGGQGASDYFLVDGNYFHHGLANGPNFTSVRRSVVRNNIFGPQTRHNVSFWQETDNPKLGSSDNKILHNLFITTAKHGVKFEANSTRNEFANNVLLGVQTEGGKVTANPKALLMEVDDTCRRQCVSREPLCLRPFRGARARRRRDRARGFLDGLVRELPRRAEPRPERLHADGRGALPRPRHAVRRCARRPQRNRAQGQGRSRPDRAAVMLAAASNAARASPQTFFAGAPSFRRKPESSERKARRKLDPGFRRGDAEYVRCAWATCPWLWPC